MFRSLSGDPGDFYLPPDGSGPPSGQIPGQLDEAPRAPDPTPPQHPSDHLVEIPPSTDASVPDAVDADPPSSELAVENAEDSRSRLFAIPSCPTSSFTLDPSSRVKQPGPRRMLHHYRSYPCFDTEPAKQCPYPPTSTTHVVFSVTCPPLFSDFYTVPVDVSLFSEWLASMPPNQSYGGDPCEPLLLNMLSEECGIPRDDLRGISHASSGGVLLFNARHPYSVGFAWRKIENRDLRPIVMREVSKPHREFAHASGEVYNMVVCLQLKGHLRPNSFVYLPTDTLFEIFQYLSDYQTFCAFGWTTRRLHTIASSALLTKILWDSQNLDVILQRRCGSYSCDEPGRPSVGFGLFRPGGGPGSLFVGSPCIAVAERGPTQRGKSPQRRSGGPKRMGGRSRGTRQGRDRGVEPICPRGPPSLRPPPPGGSRGGGSRLGPVVEPICPRGPPSRRPRSGGVAGFLAETFPGSLERGKEELPTRQQQENPLLSQTITVGSSRDGPPPPRRKTEEELQELAAGTGIMDDEFRICEIGPPEEDPRMHQFHSRHTSLKGSVSVKDFLMRSFTVHATISTIQSTRSGIMGQPSRRSVLSSRGHKMECIWSDETVDQVNLLRSPELRITEDVQNTGQRDRYERGPEPEILESTYSKPDLYAGKGDRA